MASLLYSIKSSNSLLDIVSQNDEISCANSSANEEIVGRNSRDARTDFRADNNQHRTSAMIKHKGIDSTIGASLVKPKASLSDNRLAYVDALVDANALVIESIWQLPHHKVVSCDNQVVPLRTFIQEILKRSRTTYSTLQTALFYLLRSLPELEVYIMKLQTTNINSWEDAYINCGRRMFLASLVIASKFVQDKTYRNSAWAKIAGLPVSEVNMSERVFLNLIKYQLYINQSNFERWHYLLHEHVESKTLNNESSFRDLSGLSIFAATQHADARIEALRRKSDNFSMETTYSIPSPRRNDNSVVPTAYFPLVYSSHNCSNQCTCHLQTQKIAPKKRKRNYNDSNSLWRQQWYTHHQPVLSTSVPISSDTSSMKMPTQLSPMRMNHNTHKRTWDAAVNQHATASSDIRKKRKFLPVDKLSHHS